MMERLIALGLACCLAWVGSAVELWESSALNPVELRGVAGAKPLTIVAEGEAKAVLVVPQKRNDVAIPFIKYCGGTNGPVPWPNDVRAAAFAAREIAHFVAKTTGAELAIHAEGDVLPAGMIPIYVGLSSAAEAAGFSQENLKGEGFRIANNGHAIGIIGAPKGSFGPDDGVNATVFAAYDFLERFVGVRFYYHGEQGVVTHPRKTLVVPAVAYEDYPRYIQRYAHAWTWKDQPDNCSTVSALRYRSGGNGWGSEQVYQHTPGRLDLMFRGEDKTNCLQRYGRDGANKRSTTIPPLPCYGNPKTADYAMEVWERYYAGDKTMGKIIEQAHPNRRALGFSPPDHEVWCNCDFCKKFPLDFTKPYWEWASEGYWDFIQRLARRVAAKWPEKRFYTLPYYDFTAPPTHGTFPTNCYFRLCYMWGHQNYADPYIAHETMKWVKGWYAAGHGHKLMGYLYAWPDVKNGLLVPHQPYIGLKKFYTDMLPYVDGFFNCGMSNGRPTHLFADYAEYRLLWNPAYDVEAGLDEFCRDLYGAAAEPMKRAIRTLSENYAKMDFTKLSEAAPKKPYCAPQITEAEAFAHIATPEALTLSRDAVAAADKAFANVTGEAKDRYEYVVKPFRVLFKRHDFWLRGGQSDGKTLLAEPAFGNGVKIDGALDDKAWENAQAANFERAEMVLGATEPDVQTEVKVLRLSNHDPRENGLLIGLKMTEPKLDRVVETKWGEREVYRDNSIEVLFDAGATNGAKSACFVQYVIGSNGYLLRCDGREAKVRGEIADIAKRYAVKKGDGFWSVELFIPFDELLRGIPEQDRAEIGTYKAQFCRMRMLQGDRGLYEFRSRWRTNYQRSNLDVKQFGDVIVWPNPAQYGNVRETTVRRASARPVLDGVLDDACWRTVPALPFERDALDASVPPVKVGGYFKVVRVDDPTDTRKSGLAFAVHCDEPQPATMRRPRQNVCDGDYVDVRLGCAGAAPYSNRIVLSLFDKSGDVRYSQDATGWNGEFFVTFPALFSWVAPLPEMWNFYPGTRANVIRVRRNDVGNLYDQTRWCFNNVRNADDWNARGTLRYR